MPMATQEDVTKINTFFSGFHFTPEQATQIKRRIDMLTDFRASCPCSECRSIFGGELPNSD